VARAAAAEKTGRVAVALSIEGASARLSTLLTAVSVLAGEASGLSPFCRMKMSAAMRSRSGKTSHFAGFMAAGYPDCDG
jgi:hypothetical protein